MESLTIGDVAKGGHVNVQTILYYERLGLLSKPARSLSGYRQFSAEAVRRVQFIKRAQALGFSLEEIRELLGLRLDRGSACDRVRARAEAKVADIEAKLATLNQMKRVLTKLIAACSRRDRVSGCPILDSLDAEDS